MRHWISVPVIAICGCAVPLYGRGSHAWFEMTTPHFVLRTDLDGPMVAATAAALEATRDALLAAAWPDADPADTEPTAVYVLADDRAFHHYFGASAIGIFRNGYQPDQPRA
jgi:hypothetical protein